MSAAAFDQLAPNYDTLWTDSPAGRLQRDAVWRRIRPIFRAGDRVLDLGCGTGEDAAWLMRTGAHVTATDASSKMVQRARMRDVNARVLSIEDISQIEDQFDLVLSNFGALNCVAEPQSLAPLVRPGGYAVLCVLGRFCLWETAWYLLRAQPRKAFRRWSGSYFHQGLGVRVFYPTVGKLLRIFAPQCELMAVAGIGVCVPPSYIRWLPLPMLRLCGQIDRWIAGLPIARSLADHRLLIFRRR